MKRRMIKFMETPTPPGGEMMTSMSVDLKIRV